MEGKRVTVEELKRAMAVDGYPLTLILAVWAFAVLGSRIVSTPFLHSASILAIAGVKGTAQSSRVEPGTSMNDAGRRAQMDCGRKWVYARLRPFKGDWL